MIRTLPRLFAIFLLPFLLYLLWLLARRVDPFAHDPWTRRVVLALTAAGLGCAILGLVVVGLSAPRYEGGYRPAHVENGQIVPGRMR